MKMCKKRRKTIWIKPYLDARRNSVELACVHLDICTTTSQ
jgi:hypothetical protein